MQKIKIDLSNKSNDRSYDIIIGNGILPNLKDELEKICTETTKIFVITDSNIANIHLAKLREYIGFDITKEIIIEAGESAKSFTNYTNICEEILVHKPERNSLIIAFGGGVVGDLSGFIAASLLRGMNFIQIPTTVLAMVDSSVGGKTAINSKAGKNLVGAFYQPKMVFMDLDLLNSLPRRELNAGLAEIVKYGVIDDENFFNFLESTLTNGYKDKLPEIAKMVSKSCQAKANIVSQDEQEKGVRALLNLGHTFGHVLEAKFAYDGRLLHGEAVAIGIVMALKYSAYIGKCDITDCHRVTKLFQKCGMLTSVSELLQKYSDFTITAEEFFGMMFSDKKVQSGKLTLILATAIGESYIENNVDIMSLKNFLAEEVLVK